MITSPGVERSGAGGAAAKTASAPRTADKPAAMLVVFMFFPEPPVNGKDTL
jgi:hypothetical protein